MRPLNEEELVLIKEARTKARCAHLANLLENALVSKNKVDFEEAQCVLMCPDCLDVCGANNKLSKLLDSVMDDDARQSFHAFTKGLWLESELRGKKVVSAKLTKDSLTILFNNGHELVVSLHAGPGADGEWYNWTEIEVQTKSGSITLINK